MIEELVGVHAAVREQGIVPPDDRAEDGENHVEERVNHPAYYNKHPSGVECIEIVRHHNFNVGNAIKYLWRQGLKTEEGMSDKDKQIEDLKKAIFYITDEIKRLS